MHRTFSILSSRLLQFLSGAIIGSATLCISAEPEYVLKPLDTVRVAVYQEDDLTTEARISRSGEITMPLLGSIALGGKTVKTAVSEITARLAKDYIINPSVSLSVIDYAPERVTVMGAVQKPGAVQIPEEVRLDILEAIALAGGFTEYADLSRITLLRRAGESDSERIQLIDGEMLAKPFYLGASDIVIVADKSATRVTVMGQVQKPGVLEIPDDEPLDLLEAIAMAGGYTEIADPTRVTVRRRVEGEDKLYLINGKKLAGDPQAKSFYLQPNDLITVAESFF